VIVVSPEPKVADKTPISSVIRAICRFSWRRRRTRSRGDLGTNAAIAAEEPPGPIEVSLSGEPSDPYLVAGLELLKVSVEPACGPRALRLELTTVMHQNPQVLDVTGGADLREPGSRRAILQMPGRAAETSGSIWAIRVTRGTDDVGPGCRRTKPIVVKGYPVGPVAPGISAR
jgi:hypothetical protein